jgi:hypothetical protein
MLAVSVDEKTVDSAGRRRALEHGSTVLALELSKDRAAAEVERRLRGDLVEEVLAGALEADEAERVARQAERLGHRLPQRAWVIVLEPDDDETEAALGARGELDRLDAALSGLIRSRMPGTLTIVRSASAVFLVPDEVAADLATVEKLAGQVLAAAAPVMKPGTASVGIGNLANGVSELARSHVEARQALRLTRRAGGRGRVASYRSLGAFRLLLEVQFRQRAPGHAARVRAIKGHAIAGDARGAGGRALGAAGGSPPARHSHQLNVLSSRTDPNAHRPAAGRAGNTSGNLDRLARARHAGDVGRAISKPRAACRPDLLRLSPGILEGRQALRGVTKPNNPNLQEDEDEKEPSVPSHFSPACSWTSRKHEWQSQSPSAPAPCWVCRAV